MLSVCMYLSLTTTVKGQHVCVDVLEEPQSLGEERHSHAKALQALERQAKEDVLSERNRLQTMHHLELGITHMYTHVKTQVSHTHVNTLTRINTFRHEC